MSKTVLITGASSGIGLSCVKKFLDQEWAIIAHYRSAIGPLTDIQKIVGKEQLTLVKSDFKSAGDINKLLKLVKNKKIDALINNAAGYDLSSKSKNRLKSIQDLLQVNVIAPVLIAELVLKNMKNKKKGHIVNVSSIGVKYGSGIHNIFYGASKGGLEVATKTLAREGAPYNILVNAIRPGVTDTPFYKKTSKDLNKRKKMIPLRRAAKPQEIALEIYRLCSENTFITGEIVTIAGGE